MTQKSAKMARLLGKTLEKLDLFRRGLAPRPRYRLHYTCWGTIILFAVVDGQENAEEVYKYEAGLWLSPFDFGNEDYA